MKRRVIKQGHNTLTLTLPRKWCETQNVKQGDELEITEEDSSLRISANTEKKASSIKVDISGLDRCSILYSIRNAYRMGFDQIELFFENPTTIYFRTLEKLNVLSIIHYEVNHLVGVEVVDQGNKTCTIKDISSPQPDEFTTILRRSFLLLVNGTEELVESIRTNDKDAVKATEEKHDTITKFVSYCLRLINKGLVVGYKQPPPLYHIIASLDKIADVLKYTARAYLSSNQKLGDSATELLKDISTSMRLYYEFFYKLDPNRAVEIDKNRDLVLRKLNENHPVLSKEELFIVTLMEGLLEILSDLVVTRMGLD
jgi:phosphate uptake regulator